VTLPLAERMISVMEKSDKMKQEQETRLYLMVLELQVGEHIVGIVYIYQWSWSSM
jgi:hypothetical protein